MKYVTHPLIAPGSLESREYQLAVAMRALDEDTMVVLPTGLGKTAVAILVAASRLYNEGGKVLLLAPTKPLVEQHYRFFSRFLTGVTGGTAMFTGETATDERAAAWKDATVCVATPQVVKNDLIAGRYTLRDVTLLIVDECHRAVGNYAYVFIAGRYHASAAKPRLLAMTASPGGNEDKIREICENLGVTRVETRTEDDPDVRPYVHERELEVISVRLPEPLREAQGLLHSVLDSRIRSLQEMRYDVPPREKLSMRGMMVLNAQIQERIQARDPSGYAGASIYAEIMKVRHAVSLAEGQGSTVLAAYLAKLASEGSTAGGSKASRRLIQEPAFARLTDIAAGWKEELHPKLPLVRHLVDEQLAASPESRIIVFASFRDTVRLLVGDLSGNAVACERFIGQATKDAERGLSQKKQIEALSRFRAGECRVLVATSVGEEGIDVPSTDLVIFYEPVPSEIRSIQRKGRTGRSGAGRIVVLVTKGTSDETFRYVSQSREKAMLSGIRRMGASPGIPGAGPAPGPGTEPAPEPDAEPGTPVVAAPAARGQATFDSFGEEGAKLIVDDRETSSKVVEHLSDMGIPIALSRLPRGDYAIGDRVLVERKSAADFVNTLVDRDLLAQARELSESAYRPVMIIEGGDVYAQRDVNPNAIRGALMAIAVDLGVTLLFSKDEAETAQMIAVLLRRETGGPRDRKLPLRKGYTSLREQQEMVVASFPEIGLKNARILLAHFGSVRGVVNAGEEELMAVEGIGKKKAGAISDLVRRPYP